MKYQRLLDLKKTVFGKNYFLFGARGTGKSFLIRETFKNEFLNINLLSQNLFIRLSENPSLLEEMIDEAKSNYVVIDEVQRLPALLNEIHRLIEEKSIRFLLTGSSARKLRRSTVNLLAGRARIAHLFPLTFFEIPDFKLKKYLLLGGLPEANLVEDPIDFLNSYIETYLKEEIMAEQVARNLPHFSRFLKVAALSNGELINYAKLANDSQLPESTVKNYFEALNDTLIGHTLEPWIESKKRKSIQTGKFYFFDLGVRNRLLDLEIIQEETDLFGKAFEHFIFMELRAFKSYSKINAPLMFWRSTHQHEVDFIFGTMAVEVKSKKKTTDRDAKNLFVLREEGQHKILIVVSQDRIDHSKEGIHYYHWKTFLKKLWNKEFSFS